MNPREYLYLDNFRGFEKALIPFRQVTFLLGENSSGKSSVLSILNLVRSYSFWSEADFDTDNQHLGAFQDLATEGSKAKIFTIGTARYAPTHDEKGPKQMPFALFCSYDNQEGLPRLARLTYSVGDSAIQVFVTPQGVYRRVFQLDQADITKELDERVILKIANLHASPSAAESEKLEIPSIKRLSGDFFFM
ncbi:MAG: AAA family ATPase [Limisphaerales bacterium]